jgi:hypothetical protein
MSLGWLTWNRTERRSGPERSSTTKADRKVCFFFARRAPALAPRPSYGAGIWRLGRGGMTEA